MYGQFINKIQNIVLVKNKIFFYIISIFILFVFIFSLYLFFLKKDKQINGFITFQEQYNGIEHFVIDNNINIFKTKNNFELLYFEKGKKLNELKNELKNKGKEYSIILNANYYGYGKAIKGKIQNKLNYIPAGFFQKNGEVISKSKENDKNLTVFISKYNNNFYFNDEDKINNGFDSFEAGPYIIKDNKILYNLIDYSTHGNGGYNRTIIGKDNKGFTYFVITKSKYNLKELGKTILNIKEFSNISFDFVNLDGGPSSAYYNNITKKGFNLKKELPLFFIIGK